MWCSWFCMFVFACLTGKIRTSARKQYVVKSKKSLLWTISINIKCKIFKLIQYYAILHNKSDKFKPICSCCASWCFHSSYHCGSLDSVVTVAIQNLSTATFAWPRAGYPWGRSFSGTIRPPAFLLVVSVGGAGYLRADSAIHYWHSVHGTSLYVSRGGPHPPRPLSSKFVHHSILVHYSHIDQAVQLKAAFRIKAIGAENHVHASVVLACASFA